METRQEMWLETTKQIILDSKLPYKKIADAASVSEQTVARLASGDLSKNKNTGLPTIMRIVAVCGGTLSISGSGSRIIGEELINLQGEVERITAELQAARETIATLIAEKTVLEEANQFLKIMGEHKDDIIAHKDKIIALYERVEALLKI